MRKTLLISVLAMLLSVSAYAGEMQFGVAPTPTPTPGSSSISIAQEELLAFGKVKTEETDSLTKIILNLLESALALF